MCPDFYHGRRAVRIENDDLRLTVLEEGGHIAEVYHKATGVSPLWIPPWTSMEPSEFDRLRPPDYGDGTDARLLAGIMGHSLCLDIFGGPSTEEAAAGLSAHGEGSVVPYDLSVDGTTLTARARFPLAQLEFERRLVLDGNVTRVRETLGNPDGHDRAIAWTEHVTLGPPFLERGSTQFRASATRSRVFETAFGDHDYLQASATFDWPLAPRIDGRIEDLQRFTASAASSGYTAHLMDPARAYAFFVAYSPASRLSFGYVWRPSDFPWMGIWEENHSRAGAPWRSRTLARGMEFGVSPMPESRRDMIFRGRLFGVPAYRTISAGSAISVEYQIQAATSRAIPESLDWID
jgi:hypothetical protein